MKEQDPTAEENNRSFLLEENYKSESSKEAGPSQEQIDFYHPIIALKAKGPFVNEDGRIALRAFLFSDSVYVGYLIEESDDSFYVLFMASLEKDISGMVSLNYPSTSSITRLLKSTGPMIAMPTPSQVLYYLSLTQARMEECPGYFTEVRRDFINNLIEILKKELKIVRVESNASELVRSAGNEPSKEKASDGKIIIPDLLMSKLVH